MPINEVAGEYIVYGSIKYWYIATCHDYIVENANE